MSTYNRGVRRSAIALLVLAAVLGGVGYSRVSRPEVSRAAAERLADGAWLADSLVTVERRRASLPASPNRPAADELAGTQRAIALGYLEQHRLGLGSPLRLADQARRDPRLDTLLRKRLAWALLERTMRQAGHVLEPAMLAELVTADGAGADSARAAHLRFIERTIVQAGDPRLGELALRVAYTLAEAERVLPARTAQAVASAIAVARDRATAGSDVRQLLWAARRGNRDALELLGEWRVARRFAVERPSSEERDRALDARVAAMAPVLLDTLRLLAAGQLPAGESPSVSRVPLLTARAAARLAAAARALPPQPPVVVAARSHGTRLPQPYREAFVAAATNAEALAAEHARLALQDQERPAARTILAAAVGLRAYAQAPVWFPGSSAGVTAGSVAGVLGLRDIVFDRDIPTAWRPHYLAMLQQSVRDLRRVLPTVSLEGARVHFVRESPQPGALALHDPGTRTIVLPISTAGGTLAHELAHELDWQAARRLYARRGSYSTDRAVAEQRGRLAVSLRGLSAAHLIAPEATNGYRAPHDQRPAEVFARNLDWFVAVSLARDGRMNGDLSAVQDEVLTGYASVLPGEVGGRGAQALMDVLDVVAYVHEPLRAWFLRTWGPPREASGLPLLQRVLELPLRTGRDQRGDAPLDPLAVVEGAAPVCGLRAAEHPAARLALLAVEARARAAVEGRADWLESRGAHGRAAALRGTAPWSPAVSAEALERARAALLRELWRAQWAHTIFESEERAACGW